MFLGNPLEVGAPSPGGPAFGQAGYRSCGTKLRKKRGKVSGTVWRLQPIRVDGRSLRIVDPLVGVCPERIPLRLCANGSSHYGNGF